MRWNKKHENLLLTIGSADGTIRIQLQASQQPTQAPYGNK